ncbi:regulator of sigma E protease [Allopseudospirillum japonicum]|uniref:Zinc metalloprotease n=1 Tax=Allopseudospirillum japonicum TaxID=64971 RepID=A0A1H6RFV7_9GAMM|nr:RIP metalloprotease RseP [Allopseudospirillum japonicum]SEI50485.1 regulator of sigma E protease [Allopseudospirillum japonicum]
MQWIQALLALIVTLGILISIHEFGHFWVARRCGVKVLRFSVGFGKPLWRTQDRQGTEYTLAAIPLGGYVRMLDEREAPVPVELQAQAFNRQSVGKRIAIVAAGPLANFLLAIFVYWLVFLQGIQVTPPVIGKVIPDSPAAQAGLQIQDEILAVEGEATPSWQEVSLKLIAHLGHTGPLTLSVQSHPDQAPQEVQIQVQRWLADQSQPDPLAGLGIQPDLPPIPAILGKIQAQGAAAQAGLQVGDHILSVDQTQVETWPQFVELIRASAGQVLQVEIMRDQQVQSLSLIPASKPTEEGVSVGYIGAGVAPFETQKRTLDYSLFGALGAAVAKTVEMSQLTLASIGKMLTGLIAPENLSGPITIAKVASESATYGLQSFLSFLAYVSISLGVLNLLPIPVLDGGHLAFYLVEALRGGRPLSERTQEAASRLGLAVLASLMLMAFYFDLMRL